MWSALRARDAAAWDRLLANDFAYRSPGEPDQDKAEFIQRITSFSATVLSITSEDLRANVFGEAGIVTGVQCARIALPSGFQKRKFTPIYSRRFALIRG